MNTDFKILDCTLRDGGYYTNWNFEENLITEYITHISAAGLDKIEIGLRNFHDSAERGPFFYTTDEFLDSLNLPSNMCVGVMLDAKTILNSGTPIENSVHQLFKEQKYSRISFVRLACHVSEVPHAHEIVKVLKKLGYQIFLNVMQISLYDDLILKQILKEISKWKEIDVLYFADSLGNLSPASVKKISCMINDMLEIETGFHAHDNMGLALLNCRSAIESDVKWIDVTIQGMGRGAGNMATEILLSDLKSDYHIKYKLDEIYYLACGSFSQLKRSHCWGHNVFYHLGAMKNIHPTYLQTLKSRFSNDFKASSACLKNLSSLADCTSFNEEILSDFLQNLEKT